MGQGVDEQRMEKIKIVQLGPQLTTELKSQTAIFWAGTGTRGCRRDQGIEVQSLAGVFRCERSTRRIARGAATPCWLRWTGRDIDEIRKIELLARGPEVGGHARQDSMLARRRRRREGLVLGATGHTSWGRRIGQVQQKVCPVFLLDVTLSPRQPGMLGRRSPGRRGAHHGAHICKAMDREIGVVLFI